MEAYERKIKKKAKAEHNSSSDSGAVREKRKEKASYEAAKKRKLKCRKSRSKNHARKTSKKSKRDRGYLMDPKGSSSAPKKSKKKVFAKAMLKLWQQIQDMSSESESSEDSDATESSDVSEDSDSEYRHKKLRDKAVVSSDDSFEMPTKSRKNRDRVEKKSESKSREKSPIIKEKQKADKSSDESFEMPPMPRKSWTRSEKKSEIKSNKKSPIKQKEQEEKSADAIDIFSILREEKKSENHATKEKEDKSNDRDDMFGFGKFEFAKFEIRDTQKLAEKENHSISTNNLLEIPIPEPPTKQREKQHDPSLDIFFEIPKSMSPHLEQKKEEKSSTNAEDILKLLKPDSQIKKEIPAESEIYSPFIDFEFTKSQSLVSKLKQEKNVLDDSYEVKNMEISPIKQKEKHDKSSDNLPELPKVENLLAKLKGNHDRSGSDDSFDVPKSEKPFPKHKDKEDKRKSPFAEKHEKSPFAEKREKSPLADKREKSPYAEKRDKSPYADKRDKSPYADKRDKSPFGDKRDRSPYLDKRDRSPFGDKRDRSPFGDKRERSPFADKRDRSPFGDKRDRSPFGDKRDRSPYGDKRDRSPYGDRPFRPTKIFVGHLKRSINKELVRKVFAYYGKILSLEMPVDFQNMHQNRGFCFIKYENDEQADRAIRKMDRAYFYGQELTVSPYEDDPHRREPYRPNRPGGFRGGRFEDGRSGFRGGHRGQMRRRPFHRRSPHQPYKSYSPGRDRSPRRSRSYSPRRSRSPFSGSPSPGRPQKYRSRSPSSSSSPRDRRSPFSKRSRFSSGSPPRRRTVSRSPTPRGERFAKSPVPRSASPPKSSPLKSKIGENSTSRLSSSSPP